MTKRRPIPYHASEAVDNADEDLRQAGRLLNKALDGEPPTPYYAVMADVARLIADARLWLRDVERGDSASEHPCKVTKLQTTQTVQKGR